MSIEQNDAKQFIWFDSSITQHLTRSFQRLKLRCYKTKIKTKQNN